MLKTGGNAGVLCEDVFENMVGGWYAPTHHTCGSLQTNLLHWGMATFAKACPLGILCVHSSFVTGNLFHLPSVSLRWCLPLQIVFSEAWWVGTAEDNPEEKRLPMPSDLHLPPEQQRQQQSQPQPTPEAEGDAAAQPPAKAPGGCIKSWDYGYGAADQGARRNAAGGGAPAGGWGGASQAEMGTQQQQQQADDDEPWVGASQQVPGVSADVRHGCQAQIPALILPCMQLCCNLVG